MSIRFITVFFLMLMPIHSYAMSNMPAENMKTDMLAPEFNLPTTAGQNMSLNQARQGKCAALFFWATWCPHCHEELEMVRQNLDTYKQKGLEIVLVNIGESQEKAKAYLQHQEIPLSSFVDEDTVVAEQYNVIGIPAIFLIDEKGMIRDAAHEFPQDYEVRLKN